VLFQYRPARAKRERRRLAHNPTLGRITITTADEKLTPSKPPTRAAGLTIGGCFRYASPTPLAPATRQVGGVSLSPDSCRSNQIPMMAALGPVSRASSVHTAVRDYTGDEGGPFEFDNQVLISSHRKLLWSKARVVNVAEKAGQDPVMHGRERRA